MTASHALSQLSYGPNIEKAFSSKCLRQTSVAFEGESSDALMGCDPIRPVAKCSQNGSTSRLMRSVART
jgi:hypothetical protein